LVCAAAPSEKASTRAPARAWMVLIGILRMGVKALAR
jgi:hypothetical protein